MTPEASEVMPPPKNANLITAEDYEEAFYSAINEVFGRHGINDAPAGVVAAKVSFLLVFLSFCILSDLFFFDFICEFVFRLEESIGTYDDEASSDTVISRS